MERLAKGARISGASREQCAAQLAAGYLAGASIRALAASSGRSYGFVQALLGEAGVELRSRGGARRRPVKGGTAAARTASEDVSAAFAQSGPTGDGVGTEPEAHEHGSSHKSGKKDKKGKSGKKKHKSGKKKDRKKSKKK